MIIRIVVLSFVIVCGSGLTAYLVSKQQFWVVLGNIGTVLGIISFVPLVYAIWEYIQYTRREKKERKRIHTSVGEQPVVLTVSVGGVSIRNEVESFLIQNGFKDFDFKSRVFVVHRDAKKITVDDVDGIIQDVETQVDAIRLKAVDKIHLFLKVPMPIAVMVGDVLANRIPTLVYHKQPNQGYENWGVLHR